MPTYEYACSACQNKWEEIQKISEAPLTNCPKCGKDSAKRLISGGNFILKGGGWYADLYSSAKVPAAKPAEGGSSESKGSESKGGGKSEPKSEAKVESKMTKSESKPPPSTTSSGSSGT